jgi:hypothetical protein
MITNPRNSPENEACKTWLANLAYNGVEVVIPEIADYEVRRELLRAGKVRGLGRLDALKSLLEYAPIHDASDAEGGGVLGICQEDGPADRRRRLSGR